jgi:hypothetical protein
MMTLSSTPPACDWRLKVHFVSNAGDGAAVSSGANLEFSFICYCDGEKSVVCHTD